MRFKASAEDASWTLREAAWGVEEHVLWRGTDALQDALEQAGRRMAPLQRLIQTKLTWPISDAFRERSRAARTAIVAATAAAALAAATAGAMSAVQHPAEPAAALAPPHLAAAPISQAPAPDATVLQGVAPKFVPGDQPVPAEPAAKPTVPPARVAWRFAQAFVGYEVGQGDRKSADIFAATATPALAKSLAADPPRLPAGTKVPRAQVLNVVVGDATKEQMTVSVSLLRLRATSEIRLTLTNKDNRWQVAQVLG